ncbi:unnamed protein product [Mycena citricolor]|uniref:Uncharacterized protein n=1 Tax=Mycena citricolor TaxID=2018698 RepID=A0AAD2K3Q0_9AGAR|nr:unnamed protein product [Mycena citricolor]
MAAAGTCVCMDCGAATETRVCWWQRCGWFTVFNEADRLSVHWETHGYIRDEEGGLHCGRTDVGQMLGERYLFGARFRLMTPDSRCFWLLAFGSSSFGSPSSGSWRRLLHAHSSSSLQGSTLCGQARRSIGSDLRAGPKIAAGGVSAILERTDKNGTAYRDTSIHFQPPSLDFRAPFAMLVPGVPVEFPAAVQPKWPPARPAPRSPRMGRFYPRITGQAGDPLRKRAVGLHCLSASFRRRIGEALLDLCQDS